MKRQTGLVFLGTAFITGAIAVGSSVEGCQSNSPGTGGGGASASESSSSTGTSPQTTASSTSSGTQATTSNSTSGSTSASSTSSSSSGSASYVDATIQQIANPNDPAHLNKSFVKITGAVVMTGKFLAGSASPANGRCYWGTFLSAPGLTETQPYTGLFVFDEGTQAATSGDGGTAFCPVIQAGQAAGGVLPDDLKPGDKVDIIGQVTTFLNNSCATTDGGTGTGQIQLQKLVSVTKTGTAALPTPHVLTSAEATELATQGGGGDAGADVHTQWAGVKVRAASVSAVPQGGMLTDTFGNVKLTDGLQFGDKLYYVGFVKKSDVCHNGPVYASTSQAFTSVDAFVYLDFCTWDLQPSNKCHDLSPASEDCASVADAGSDAGSDVICSQ